MRVCAGFAVSTMVLLSACAERSPSPPKVASISYGSVVSGLSPDTVEPLCKMTVARDVRRLDNKQLKRQACRISALVSLQPNDAKAVAVCDRANQQIQSEFIKRFGEDVSALAGTC